MKLGLTVLMNPVRYPKEINGYAETARKELENFLYNSNNFLW